MRLVAKDRWPQAARIVVAFALTSLASIGTAFPRAHEHALAFEHQGNSGSLGQRAPDVEQPATLQNVPGCGNLSNPYGPFDYNDPTARAQKLPRVEQHHFTPIVQSLQSGQSGSLTHDLGYTLRAFPNHPRALDAASRYELKGGHMVDLDVRGAECFFKRAIAFRPEDSTVRMLYANYLVKRKRRDDAREQYDKALELAPNAAEVNYNAGLFFLEEGDVARARELASVAYAHGYPLPGLRNKIAAADETKQGR